MATGVTHGNGQSDGWQPHNPVSQQTQRLGDDDRTKLLPVVIPTSSDEDKDIVDSYAHGANSYVCKPVKFEDFSRAVREVGLFWLLTNTEPPPLMGS